MRFPALALTTILAAGGTTVLPAMLKSPIRTVVVVDTIFVKPPAIDYNEIARRVARLNRAEQGPMTIDGDLIVKGRIGVGGSPEPGTNYPITVHGQGDSRILFVSNEALNDGQRIGTQHRHVGAVGVSHDGVLPFRRRLTIRTGDRPQHAEPRASAHRLGRQYQVHRSPPRTKNFLSGEHDAEGSGYSMGSAAALAQ